MFIGEDWICGTGLIDEVGGEDWCCGMGWINEVWIGMDVVALVGRWKWEYIDEGGGGGGGGEWNCGMFVCADWLFGAGWIDEVGIGIDIVVWDEWMYRACWWVGIKCVVLGG